MVELSAVNRSVVGSSPTSGANFHRVLPGLVDFFRKISEKVIRERQNETTPRSCGFGLDNDLLSESSHSRPFLLRTLYPLARTRRKGEEKGLRLTGEGKGVCRNRGAGVEPRRGGSQAGHSRGSGCLRCCRRTPATIGCFTAPSGFRICLRSKKTPARG